MDFEFTDEQQELRASVRAVLERECPVSLVREVVEKGAAAGDLWSRMVELDWPALTIPEEAGGIGLGFVELAVVAEEMGRVVAPGPWLATVTQFAPAVREAGTPEQQATFLAAVAEGRTTGALAVAEETGSWSPEAVEATATRAGDGGGGWVLAGTKQFVLDGATADEVVVAARAGDGIGLFVVPGRDLAATPLTTLDATMPLATVDLTGVRVPAERVLGEPGSPAVADALRRAVEEAVAAMALSTLGTCQAIFDTTLDYAKQREQFGVPIGSFQAVKHKLADMHVALERARAVCYFAALTIAEEDERRTLAAAMAKAAAGDCQRLVVQDGLQLHGGIGYTWEHDLHLFLKRAKAGDAQLGTASAHRATVAALSGLDA